MLLVVVLSLLNCCCLFNPLLFYHQVIPRNCQTLAGSLLGFLATRADTPLVTIHVFISIFSKLTNLNGEISLYMLFVIAYVTDMVFLCRRLPGIYWIVKTVLGIECTLYFCCTENRKGDYVWHFVNILQFKFCTPSVLFVQVM